LTCKRRSLTNKKHGNSAEMTRERICVIGGGAAGLVAISKLLQSKNFEIQCFEQKSALGGVWDYSETDQDFNIANHDSSINPIYPSLKTNLPAKLMSFKDFVWTNDDGSALPDDYFPSHQKVLKYLQDYAQKMDLESFIQFNSTVLAVSKADKSKVWKVSVLDNATGITIEHSFDSVFLCNGHFADPNVPLIPGLEEFQGIASHSISYEISNVYAGKRYPYI
jgi:cation diffusion facilitator CzcD-associated flavoprotein CzcO